MLEVTSIHRLNGSNGPAHDLDRGRPPCWLEVDLSRVGENVRRVRDWAGSAVSVMAIVKADGYGLGAIGVARTALAAGAQQLGVARVAEGVALREAGIQAPILLLTGIAPQEVEAAVATRLTVTLADQELLPALCTALTRTGERATVHLKVDTGLTRYGGRPDEVEALAAELAGDPRIRLEGLFTHFANAEDHNSSFMQEQLERFCRMRRSLERSGHVIPFYHAANTAATLRSRTTHLDLVRFGIGLYGSSDGVPDPEAPVLLPAVQLKARVLRVTSVEAGTTVGYGQTFTCDAPSRLALVGAGYADGVPRALSNRGAVLVEGGRAPIVGRVSMDQCVIDASSIPAVRSGSEVVFYGVQGAARLTLAEVAAVAASNEHELLCRVGARVPRVYLS